MLKIMFILYYPNIAKMQVIALTEELLATAKQNEISGSDIGPGTSASPSLPQPKVSSSAIQPIAFCLCMSDKYSLWQDACGKGKRCTYFI